LMEEKVIYTMGYGGREFDEFVELLRFYGVEVVVDVRRFPTSKREEYKRENFERLLAERGFKYVYLGDLLGGYRSGGYESYMETSEYKRGIERVIELAEKYRVAIVCCERFPWRCHRRFIGDTLKKMGLNVIHVIDKDRIWRTLFQS